MKSLLRLYPPEWRARYQAEVADLIEADDRVVGLALDLAVGALDAWLHLEWFAEAALADGGTMNRMPILPFDTANTRFKERSTSVFWSSMIAATALHFGVIAFWPNLQAAEMSFSMDDLVAIELPPEIEIPPAPEAISRPASPVISPSDIPTDVTIPETDFDDRAVDPLPPPPARDAVSFDDTPPFIPREVEPSIRNREAVVRALQREYPSTLRDAGVVGRVVMYVFVNEDGVADEVRVAETSGFDQFDRAALRVAATFEFNPAMNQGQAVAVWALVPVTFRVAD